MLFPSKLSLAFPLRFYSLTHHGKREPVISTPSHSTSDLSGVNHQRTPRTPFSRIDGGKVGQSKDTRAFHVRRYTVSKLWGSHGSSSWELGRRAATRSKRTRIRATESQQNYPFPAWLDVHFDHFCFTRRQRKRIWPGPFPVPQPAPLRARAPQQLFIIATSSYSTTAPPVLTLPLV